VRPVLAIGLAVSLAACGGEPGLLVYSLDAPAGPGSAEPNLALGSDGFYLTWLEPADSGRHALRFARWNEGGWSEPGTIVERDDLFVNWADFPSLLVLDHGAMAAHWLERSGPSTYAYGVRMAISRDSGATWGDVVVPHRDSARAEHGFVSLFPVDEGVGAVWLDGRATVDGDPMTLRFTALSPAGEPGPERLLDESTCDCCQTGTALTDDGPVVVYRGRTADEVRDIRIVRRVDGRWTHPEPVHRDGWVIDACPVNGPAIDASGRRVAVAWFTAATPEDRPDPQDRTDHGRVLLAFSEDGGATFGEPVRVDGGGAMGRVDVELMTDGAAVVWLERTAAGAAVRFLILDLAGRPITGATLGSTSASRVSGFPRMVAAGNRLLFAFTEPATDSTATRVRTLHAELGRQKAAP
jgi:hypothetical protein